jgi:hypothetical protein
MVFRLNHKEHDEQVEEVNESVRCPICGHWNQTAWLCNHVRWTFGQGDPIAFAKQAVAGSPATARLGFRPADLTPAWWEAHGERVLELVHWRFAPVDGYVFGDPADIDLLARDIWKEFAPPPARPDIPRTAGVAAHE